MDEADILAGFKDFIQNSSSSKSEMFLKIEKQLLVKVD